jgi:hypothetical protein
LALIAQSTYVVTAITTDRTAVLPGTTVSLTDRTTSRTEGNTTVAAYHFGGKTVAGDERSEEENERDEFIHSVCRGNLYGRKRKFAWFSSYEIQYWQTNLSSFVEDKMILRLLDWILSVLN